LSAGSIFPYTDDRARLPSFRHHFLAFAMSAARNANGSRLCDSILPASRWIRSQSFTIEAFRSQLRRLRTTPEQVLSSAIF
jgi:hypothetical protein